jgi:S1-C subfamily serine protease
VSSDRAAAEEMVRRTGQMGVPVTVIDGETVVGFDRSRLERIVQRMKTPRRPATLGAAVKDVDGGALVGTVHPGTPAERGGLMPGDVIVAVDGTPVGDAATLARLIQEARARGAATMTVQRATDRIPLRIPLAAA